MGGDPRTAGRDGPPRTLTAPASGAAGRAEIISLFQSQYWPLVRLALLLVDDVDSAEDVVQEAYPDRGVTARLRMPGGSSIFDEFDPQLGSGSDGRTLWSMTAGKELVAVDVATGRVVDRVLINNGPYHSQVAVLGDTVWVPLRGTSTSVLFRWRDR